MGRGTRGSGCEKVSREWTKGNEGYKEDEVEETPHVFRRGLVRRKRERGGTEGKELRGQRGGKNGCEL